MARTVDTREFRAHIGRTVLVEGCRGGTLRTVAEDPEDGNVVCQVKFRSGRIDALDIDLIF